MANIKQKITFSIPRRLRDVDESTGVSQIDQFSGRQWLLPILLDWLDDDSERIFLLTGGPGTGKSMIYGWLAGYGPAPEDTTAADQLANLRQRVTAVHFCQANTRNITAQAFAESIANQLTESILGFSDALKDVLADRIMINTTQNIGTASDSTVTGVSIGKLTLSDLDDSVAFDRTFVRPLQKLYADGYAEPILILIDALDEAFPEQRGKQFVRLLAQLSELPRGVRLLISTRVDVRVLQHFRTARRFDLVNDVPEGVTDIREFAATWLVQRQKLDATRAQKVAKRIEAAAAGIFLYAYLVLKETIPTFSTTELESEFELPTGLTTFYQNLIFRELGQDYERWHDEFRPLLGLIGVAQGVGFTRRQLQGLLGQDPIKNIRICYQFLSGPLNDGPFQLFHKSLSDFLFDDLENVDYAINSVEMHTKCIESLMPDDWARSGLALDDDYALRHLHSHYISAIQGLSGSHVNRLVDDLARLLDDINYIQTKSILVGQDAPLSDYSTCVTEVPAILDIRPDIQDLASLLEGLASYNYRFFSEPVESRLQKGQQWFVPQLLLWARQLELPIAERLVGLLQHLDQPYLEYRWSQSTWTPTQFSRPNTEATIAESDGVIYGVIWALTADLIEYVTKLMKHSWAKVEESARTLNSFELKSNIETTLGWMELQLFAEAMTLEGEILPKSIEAKLESADMALDLLVESSTDGTDVTKVEAKSETKGSEFNLRLLLPPTTNEGVTHEAPSMALVVETMIGELTLRAQGRSKSKLPKDWWRRVLLIGSIEYLNMRLPVNISLGELLRYFVGPWKHAFAFDYLDYCSELYGILEIWLPINKTFHVDEQEYTGIEARADIEGLQFGEWQTLIQLSVDSAPEQNLIKLDTTYSQHPRGGYVDLQANSISLDRWADARAWLPFVVSDGLYAAGRSRRLVHMSSNGVLSVWDNDVSDQVWRAETDVRGLLKFALTADERIAVCTSMNRTVCAWDLISQNEILYWFEETIPTGICIAPDGPTLITIWADGWVRVHDLTPGRENRAWFALAGDEDSHLTDVVTTGNRVYTGLANGEIRVWELSSGDFAGVRKLEAPVTSLAVSSDDQIVVGCDDGTISIIEIESNGYIQSFSISDAAIETIWVSADRKLAVIRSVDERTSLIDLAPKVPDKNNDPVLCSVAGKAVVFPEENKLAVIEENRLTIYRLTFMGDGEPSNSGLQEVATIEMSHILINCDFAKDGKTVFVSDIRGVVHCFAVNIPG